VVAVHCDGDDDKPDAQEFSDTGDLVRTRIRMIVAVAGRRATRRA
jgi:hypothetical protein